MKHLRALASVFPAFLLVANTVAQAGSPQFVPHPESDGDIAAARCKYTPTEGACRIVHDSGQNTQKTRDPDHDTTLAQLPQHRPGPPLRPQRPPMGHPRAPYPAMGISQGNGRHAIIGALIGFGLGAARGAKANKDQHPGATAGAALLFGLIGAGVGTAIGAGVPSFHARNPYRNRWPDDDESASSSKPANPGSTENSRQRTASLKPPPSESSSAGNPVRLSASAP